jgi:hypothetical protein
MAFLILDSPILEPPLEGRKPEKRRKIGKKDGEVL